MFSEAGKLSRGLIYKLKINFSTLFVLKKAVLWMRIRIRMLLDLPDPHPDPFVTSADPDPDPDPSIIKQKVVRKTLIYAVL
jgi:hypothetical protein